MSGSTSIEMGGRALFHQNVDGCLADAVGAGGLSADDWQHALSGASSALDRLKQMRADGSLALLGVGDDAATAAEEVATAYEKLSRDARTIVFFGTGGSGLGGQTLAQFGGWSIPGVAHIREERRPATRFYDNLDPFTLSDALARFDLSATRFVVTSKSGGTPETLSQALAAIQAAKDAGLGERLPDLFLGITEPARDGARNGLRDLLEAHGISCLDHHTGIGGRFAVLTNVGLLPAVARGVDPARVLAGAKAVVDALEAADGPAAFAPCVGAALAVALHRERGMRVQVMMPYADRLGKFGHWYVQLWAESLGKDGKGTTPLACLGPLDQHSQLQLFMDGPLEHYLTFVRVPMEGTGPRIDAGLAATAGIDVLAGKTVGDLVAAQTHAVPQALMQAGRPVRIFDVPKLDEESIGALLMHFMLETILAGWLLDVDPFDQPAVELGKQLTRKRLAGEI